MDEQQKPMGLDEALSTFAGMTRTESFDYTERLAGITGLEKFEELTKAVMKENNNYHSYYRESREKGESYCLEVVKPIDPLLVLNHAHYTLMMCLMEYEGELPELHLDWSPFANERYIGQAFWNVVEAMEEFEAYAYTQLIPQRLTHVRIEEVFHRILARILHRSLDLQRVLIYWDKIKAEEWLSARVREEQEKANQSYNDWARSLLGKL